MERNWFLFLFKKGLLLFLSLLWLFFGVFSMFFKLFSFRRIIILHFSDLLIFLKITIIHLLLLYRFFYPLFLLWRWWFLIIIAWISPYYLRKLKRSLRLRNRLITIFLTFQRRLWHKLCYLLSIYNILKLNFELFDLPLFHTLSIILFKHLVYNFFNNICNINRLLSWYILQSTARCFTNIDPSQ